MEAAPPDIAPVFFRNNEFSRPPARPSRCPVSVITTAAHLLGDNPPRPAVAPDSFAQGMLVCHPAHGVGRIVALSGGGVHRKATVEFLGKNRRERFVLAESPLQPVERPGSG